MVTRIFSLICLSFFASFAYAGIEKIALPTDQGFRMIWWPKVDPGGPWNFDEMASRQNALKMFVPSGSTFANAETVMYAKANFKPRTPDTKALKSLIDNDVANIKTEAPGIKIEVMPPVTDGDGKSVQVVSFIPTGGQGNWEWVAYGEDGEYFLVFTVSSRTKLGLEKSLPAFKAMIASYHAEP